MKLGNIKDLKTIKIEVSEDFGVIELPTNYKELKELAEKLVKKETIDSELFIALVKTKVIDPKTKTFNKKFQDGKSPASTKNFRRIMIEELKTEEN